MRLDRTLAEREVLGNCSVGFPGNQQLQDVMFVLLTQSGEIPSMPGKATCLDNAVIEHCFGHLKAEMVHHATFANAAALIDALHESIVWYNPKAPC